MTRLVITAHTEQGDVIEYDSSKAETLTVEKKATKKKKSKRKKQKDVVHEDDHQEKQT